MTDFEIEGLAKRHDRTSFDCGIDDLNTWLQQFAGQNEKLKLTKTFVVVRPSKRRVVGYYAIRAGEVSSKDLPERLRKRLPRYPIPVLHLARLAVDRSTQGEGVGAFILMDCLSRAIQLSDKLGLHAIEVNALTDEGRAFYEKYGFFSLLVDENHLYLSIKTARQAFGVG